MWQSLLLAYVREDETKNYAGKLIYHMVWRRTNTKSKGQNHFECQKISLESQILE